MSGDYRVEISGPHYGEKPNGNRPRYLIIHHGAGVGIRGRVRPARWWMKAYHDFHMRTYDSPCKYHYGVSPEGDVAPGRQEGTIGGHTAGRHEGVLWNRQSLAVVLIGNYDVDDVAEALWEAAISLCVDLMLKYDIPVENVLGHWEANILSCGKPLKSCPGKRIRMDAFRADLTRELEMQEAPA